MRRRNLFRTLILAGALVTLSVPVFSVVPASAIPGLNWLVPVSACSTGTQCSTTGTITGTVGTFFSPISIQTSPSNEVQTQRCGEPGSNPSCPLTITIPAALTFGVSDPRGQSQGFTAFIGGPGTSLMSLPGTPPQFMFSVDGSAFTVDNINVGLTSCFGSCAPIVPLAGAIGMNLTNPVGVAQECTVLADMGLGIYAIDVGYHITLTGAAAEDFEFVTGEYGINIPVSVGEGPNNTGGVC